MASLGQWILDPYRLHEQIAHIRELYREYDVWAVGITDLHSPPNPKSDNNLLIQAAISGFCSLRSVRRGETLYSNSAWKLSVESPEVCHCDAQQI
jgi:hypothetical protein